MVHHDMAPESSTHPSMEECIQNCFACQRICLETFTYCLQQGGTHMEPNHLRLLLDCSDICQTSAQYMVRESPLHGRTCGVCAEVCRQCAESCMQRGDDPQMQACAEACRRCAATCQQMAGMATS